MATNTQIIDYCLYDYNDKHGRVPWADDATKRADFESKLVTALGISA